MRKITTDIRERISLRAYYAWLNVSTATAEANWAEAEGIELAYAERRAAAARKAAETRKAKTGLKGPIAATAAEHRPAIRFPTAH